MKQPPSKLDFGRFNTGTLFLIRTPETFPVGYAEKCLRDMKENLHLDYAAWLETWNCMDGIIWPHPDFPRSSYWRGCDRDPLEETFLAADETGMAFLPEAGVMDDDFMLSHREAMRQLSDGRTVRYGRVGLVPACEWTADYLIAKYEALIGKYGHHPSFKGICMPAENSVQLSCDRFTRAAYRRMFGSNLPPESEWRADAALYSRLCKFAEEQFLAMYRRLARHLKSKYGLPLMHYPMSKVSVISHHEPNEYCPVANLELIHRVKEIDLLNLQLHPPLGNQPRQFKMELELLEAVTDRPFVADTHFYHETNAGKLPDLTPKRFEDWILGTLSPYGVSFFCYGFMAEELPLWKKEINPNVKVASCYADDDAVRTRRKSTVRAMEHVELLRPYLEGTHHEAACAVFYRESLDGGYRFGSYYREHLFGLYEALQATALPLVFTGEIPEDANSCRMLIFDAVKEFSETDAARLKRFIAAGGKAVLTGRCDAALCRVCGFEIAPVEAEYVAEPETGNWLFSVPVDAVKYTTDGEKVYCYNTGAGAAVRRGNCWFIGANCAISAFSDMRQTGVIRMWKEILRECGADSGVKLKTPYLRRNNEHEYLSSDLYVSADGGTRLLFLRNFGVEATDAELTWELPVGWRVKETVVDGHRIVWSNGGKLPAFGFFVLLVAGQA